MKHTLLARVQSMAKEELLDLIPKDTLDRIKASGDKKPEFRAYVIGHEGQAKPNELSGGMKVQKAFNWMKDVVVGLVNRLGYGCPVFDGHGSDNSHAGRQPIGEVVGRAVREIGNKISAIAAVYLLPEHRKKQLDIASVEAEIEYVQDDNENEVLDVREVTGIALGNSAMAMPGFPGATLLSTVQAFSKQDKGDTPMDLKEVKAAIKEGKFKITDLFDRDEILESAPVSEEVDKHKGHAKRVEKQLGEEREKVVDLTKKVEETGAKVKGLNEKLSSQTGKTMFDASATTRKLNDKEKAFISRNLNNFKSEKADAELTSDFERWMDSQMAEYMETAKLLGVDTGKQDDGKGKEDDGKGGGTGPTDGKDAAGNIEDKYTNAKTNDLIPA